MNETTRKIIFRFIFFSLALYALPAPPSAVMDWEVITIAAIVSLLSGIADFLFHMLSGIADFLFYASAPKAADPKDAAHIIRELEDQLRGGRTPREGDEQILLRRSKKSPGTVNGTSKRSQ